MPCGRGRKRNALAPAVDSEKPETKRRCRKRRFVEKTSLFLRCWQLVSALAIYASFSLLFQYIEHHRLGGNMRMFSIIKLSRCVLVYTVLVITTTHIFKQFKLPIWVVFAKISLPGDLLMMALFIAKITVLSIAGLPADCHGLTRENYNGDDLVRQPRDGFSTIRFGPGTLGNVGELDRFCQVPRAAYALCVADIFSYTLAFAFTLLRLQAHYRQKKQALEERSLPSGHVEEQVSHNGLHCVSSEDPDVEISLHSLADIPAVELRPNLPLPRTSTSTVRGSDSVSVTGSLAGSITTPSLESCDETVPTTPTSESADHLSRRSIRSDAISWRTSQDTLSSAFDPNHYIISDGFRPPTQPPAYSSRPSSICSGK